MSLSTNPAIDLSNVPYWVDAAMFGAYFDYYQLNATDSNAASSPVITALAGSLVVAAGKVVFGWVPKVKPVYVGTGCSGRPISGGVPGSTAKPFQWSCYQNGQWVFGGTIDANDYQTAHDLVAASAAQHPSLQCFVSSTGATIS